MNDTKFLQNFSMSNFHQFSEICFFFRKEEVLDEIFQWDLSQSIQPYLRLRWHL